MKNDDYLLPVPILLLSCIIVVTTFGMGNFSTNSQESIIMLISCMCSILIEEALPIIFPKNTLARLLPFFVFTGVVSMSVIIFYGRDNYSTTGIKNMLIQTTEPLIVGTLTWVILYFSLGNKPSLKENTKAIIAFLLLLILNSLTEGVFLANTKDGSIRIVIKIIGVGYDILGAMIVYKHFIKLPANNIVNQKA